MGSGASFHSDRELVEPIPVQETVFEASAVAEITYSFDSYDGSSLNKSRSRSSSSPTCRESHSHGYFGATDWLGRKHGYGVMKFDNQDVYYGEWHEGQMSGNGTFKYSNGDIYTGVFLANKKHGHGLMKYKAGGHYDGEWQYDLKHGYGVEKSPDGSEYSGQFVEDRQTVGDKKQCDKLCRTMSREDAAYSQKRTRKGTVHELLVEFDPEMADL